MMEECPCKPMAPQTSAKTFGISHHLAASQACHVQEVQSSDPCVELNCYLSDPLEQPGINMFCFWMVSFPLTFYFNIIIIVGCIPGQGFCISHTKDDHTRHPLCSNIISPM